MCLGVILGDQLLDGLLAEGGIGIELGPVGKGQFLGFHEQVQMLGAIVPERSQVMLLENVQHLKGGDSLTVRRQFPDVVAAIIGADRLDPVAFMLGKVLEREIAPVLLAEGHDFPRNLSFIERPWPLLGDDSQRSREARVFHHFTHSRCSLAVNQERGG